MSLPYRGWGTRTLVIPPSAPFLLTQHLLSARTGTITSKMSSLLVHILIVHIWPGNPCESFVCSWFRDTLLLLSSSNAQIMMVLKEPLLAAH